MGQGSPTVTGDQLAICQVYNSNGKKFTEVRVAYFVLIRSGHEEGNFTPMMQQSKMAEIYQGKSRFGAPKIPFLFRSSWLKPIRNILVKFDHLPE